MITRLADAHEADLASVAAHEGGHLVVARFYGLKPRAFVAGPRTGICACEVEPEMRQNAILAWGGLMGEALSGRVRTGRALPALSPDAWPHELSAWIRAVRAKPEEWSTADWEKIVLSDDSAAESAFRILTVLRPGALKAAADFLVKEYRERVSAAIVRGSAAADQADAQRFARLYINGPDSHFVAFMRRLPEPPGGTVVHAQFGIPIET